jgi:hypothetical protein
MNCTGKTKKKFRGEGFTYTRCPGNFFNPGYAMLFDVHRQYRKGILAYPGGILDQPAKYNEAMTFIENIVVAREIEQAKSQTKKQNQGVRRVR